MKIQGKQVKTQIFPGLQQVKKVIAIASGKGGVGKSTVTRNLAEALKAQGHSVGVLDADIYGPSQNTLWGDDSRAPRAPHVKDNMIVPLDAGGIKYISMGLLTTNQQAVVWRAPMATKALSQFMNAAWGELDYLLVDLPPGTGDIHITLTQQINLTGAIIVTTPQKLSVGIAEKGVYMFAQVNVPVLGIVENMSGYSCPHCDKETALFRKGGGDELASKHGIDVLTRIPIDPLVVERGDEGQSLFEEGGEQSKAAERYLDLAKTLDTRAELAVQKARETRPATIDMIDGHLKFAFEGAESTQGTLEARDLRLLCPCANCVDENTGRPLLDPAKVPLDIKVRGIRPIGNYGIALEFTEAHPTGIYRFTQLKKWLQENQNRTEEGLEL